MNDNEKKTYQDVKALLLILKFHNKSVNDQNLIHEFRLQEKEGIDYKICKRICKKFHLKCQAFTCKPKDLDKLVYPLMYMRRDNSMHIAIKKDKGQIYCLDMETDKAITLSIEEFVQQWNGKVMLFKENLLGDEETKFGYAWFLKVILKYKGAIIQVLLAYFVIQLIGLSIPVFIQFILDKVLSTGNIDTLLVLSAMISIALLFELFLTVAKDYVFSFTTNRIDMQLNAKIMKHLFSLPLAYFEKRRVGDTIAKVREVENIRSFLTGTPLLIVLDMFFVFVYIILLFFYSTTLSFIILAIVPLVVLIYASVTPVFKKRLDKKYHDGAELQSFIVESMNGIHTVKSFALEYHMNEKWDHIAAEYINTSYQTRKLVFLTNDTIGFLQKIQDIITISTGAVLVINRQLSVGELVAFRMIASRITSPLLRFVQMWQDYQQMNLSVKRVSDIFQHPTEFTGDDAMSLPQLKGTIRFEHVDFRYQMNQRLVLHDISFQIEPGQIVGVIGRSGSGKSTLSKLIQRLYVPENGRVYFDDIDMATANPSWLRRQIGVVLQETFVFNATVKENIAITNLATEFSQIEHVSRISGAHEFIMQLEQGYNTLIGEKGVGLSGGQKQRLAIARALLSDPKILIFDEATSALDYESERIIQNNLKAICAGRTVMIIAHRLSTLKDCDLIMSLDNGKIIEYDRPQNLLKQEGSFYRYLMEQQEVIV